MDHELLKRGLGFTRRRKKWIALLAAFGVSSYAAYRVYHLPSVTRKRKKLVKLLGALVSVLEMASESAETISLISKDMKVFLQSDTDETPRSLKQISKIASSHEFSQSVSRVTEALTIGIMRGYKTGSHVRNGTKVGVQSADHSDKVMDRLFSSAGTGFASVVVGSFARNLVLGFYSNGESINGPKAHGEECLSRSSEMPGWLNVASDDKFKELIGDCIEKFVGTAVAVYLDKTIAINTYDEMFTGLTNPKHQNKVQDILVAVCNNAIETLIRTSHQVLTSPESGAKSSCLIVDQTEDPSIIKEDSLEHLVPSKYKISSSFTEVQQQDGGWTDKVSSTLAVPSNRKFILDVTGRVTFQTMRSILLFLSWKLSEVTRRSLGAVHDEVVGRGLQVTRFISDKSSVIVTLCLALYLHVLGSTGVVLAA